MGVAKNFITPDEYLKMERHSETKHEYFNGRIYAMTGASEAHNTIAGNLIGILYAEVIDKGCRVYPGDMRVKVSPTGLYTYPDVTVVCGKPQTEKNELDTLLNPILLVEILSPSTAEYDRSEKFRHYRTLKSLQDYLLVSQDRVWVEHYTLRAGEWIYNDATTLDALLNLPSINTNLPLAKVYQNVNFEDKASPAPPGKEIV